MNAELALQNLWWQDKNKIAEDRHLKALQKQPFQWSPSILTEAELAGSGVLTLRGPRQVGKTTYIKTLLQKLLAQGIEPARVFYYTLDLVADDKELFEIYRRYHEFAPPGRRYVFFDEITLVSRWEYALKHIIDLGLGEETLFLLSGSSAADLRRGSERLPGRRHLAHPDKVLLPISFREFCILKKIAAVPSVSLTNWRSDLRDALPKLKIFAAEIQSYFRQYLVCGGFPPAIGDLFRDGKIAEDTLETYQSVVISDFEKFKKDRIILRDVTRRLLENLATPVSWNNLAKHAGNVSMSTAKEYVQLLADSFLVYILEFLKRGKGVGETQKNRKIYPVDPFLYTVFAQIAGIPLDSAFSSKIIEGVVGSHLLRCFQIDLHEGFANLPSLFYWQSTKGNEVDFVALLNDQTEMPVEVKDQSSLAPSDYLTIKKSFKNGLVLTKDGFFEDEKILALPIACFLYCLP